MEITQIEEKDIPDCCGSCRYFRTLNGAECGEHKIATFAFGICDDYERKSEYKATKN